MRKNVPVIDGIRTELVAADLDRDGVVGGTEKVQQKFDSGQVPIKESTELGDALTEFNRDDISKERLSSIDFKSRIDPLELPPMIVLDVLIAMGVLTAKCGMLNRVKMRKSVSLKGLGRGEYVDIVTGKKQQDIQAGIMQKTQNYAGFSK